MSKIIKKKKKAEVLQTYKVLMEESDYYVVIVEAKNEIDAATKAHEEYSNGNFKETGDYLVEVAEITKI